MSSPLRSVVATFALMLAIVAAPAAHAFCRSVVAMPPIGHDPEQSGCWPLTEQPSPFLFWRSRCTGYNLHMGAGAQVPLADFARVTAAAFAAWQASACPDGAPSIQVQDLGPVGCTEARYNRTGANQNLIVFRDTAWPHPDPNALAVTIATINTRTGELLDADIEINGTMIRPLSTAHPAPAGTFDLQTILTHEAGHFLGLAHSADPGSMMFARYAMSAELQPDDVQGLCAVYPASGDRFNGSALFAPGACDATPRGGQGLGCDEPTVVAEGAPPGGCTLAARGRPGPMALSTVVLIAALVRRRRIGAARARASWQPLVMSQEARRQLKDLAKELVNAGKNAHRRGKPRDWHRLRTTSRRLRGALIAHAELLDPARQPRLARRAKGITKLPTKVRDLDVAKENLEVLSALAETKAQRRAAREMRRRMARKRDELDRRLRKRLRRKEPARVLAAKLKRALRHPVAGARPAHAPADVLAAPARAVRERWSAVGDWQDDKALHGLRVAVKKYRGALAARSGQAREQRTALETLQKVQDILGQHHDWSMLGQRLDARRLALANDGARHGELVGYEGLLARARHEQKARYDAYRAELHTPLGLLVEAITPLEARVHPWRVEAPPQAQA